MRSFNCRGFDVLFLIAAARSMALTVDLVSRCPSGSRCKPNVLAPLEEVTQE